MKAQEKFSILLVDDDSMVVRILSRILADFAPLRFATSGRAALKLARDSTPDLVLLDVDMPVLSGFEVCKAFKSDPARAEEWLRAQRSAAPLALLLADIEGFTAYNAEFGEEKGDDCLKSVAEILRSAGHRPTDVLGRYAGGKFALLLPETGAQGASVVAQRAIDAVEALRIV